MPPQGAPVPETLRMFPKVDLHRHLEGSVRFSTALELAQAGRIPLPADAGELRRLLTVVPGEPRRHSHFLSKFVPIRRIFQSADIIRRVVVEAISDAAAEEIRYLELHVTPSAVGQELGMSPQAVLDLVLDAGRSASESGAQIGWVVSVNRHEDPSLAASALAAAADLQSEEVVGVDLAGDESGHGVGSFVSAFRQAKEAGLAVSVHAGEWDGPASVRSAIEQLDADRIAHGVRVLEDRDVTLLARDRGLHFAVCLTSNLQSGVVDSLSAHPLPQMIQAGLQLSLNSDDPAVSCTDLPTEYSLAVNELGLSLESLRGMVMAAAQASFLPIKSKRALMERVQQDIGLAPISFDRPSEDAG
ncbi:MAG: adenosine deaminase [Anaerolineales bacterium]